MSADADVIYRYDGSFAGLLCCVFASYEQKEIPTAIYSPQDMQLSLLFTREIYTNEEKSQRVLRSIPEKIHQDALDFIRRIFLTCLPQKELYILLFLRRAYKEGPSILQNMADPLVNKLYKAVRHLENEAHLLKGFIRFSDCENVLATKIGPKNHVLPLLADHFCDRYPEEKFLIYDEVHRQALLYQPYQIKLVEMDAMDFPVFDESEEKYRELWQAFYDAVEIKARHNPKCRMSLMPKRYWKYMTEFDRTPGPRDSSPEDLSPYREVLSPIAAIEATRGSMK